MKSKKDEGKELKAKVSQVKKNMTETEMINPPPHPTKKMKKQSDWSKSDEDDTQDKYNTCVHSN